MAVLSRARTSSSCRADNAHEHVNAGEGEACWVPSVPRHLPLALQPNSGEDAAPASWKPLAMSGQAPASTAKPSGGITQLGDLVQVTAKKEHDLKAQGRSKSHNFEVHGKQLLVRQRPTRNRSPAVRSAWPGACPRPPGAGGSVLEQPGTGWGAPPGLTAGDETGS